MVIIRANPNLIKEIQLTVWEAREYLTGITTAQITGQTENHLITYYCYCRHKTITTSHNFYTQKLSQHASFWFGFFEMFL